MGKWNRRYYPRSNRHSRYQDYDWSPPRETYRDPELGVWQDNVPMWEKKFCFLSGVPWEKVLSTKKFIHCNSNILEWDDTAGKEAFHNAKECYWAKLNGGQCEITPPDPDAYIGEIDWNPYIDPELIKVLDQTFFVPDDKENSFDSLKDHKSDNPWDCDHVQIKSAGWNQWDDSPETREEPTDYNNPWECNERRDSATMNYDDKDNPWERGYAQTSQASNDKATGWNQWDVSADSRDKPTNDSNAWEYHDKNPWEHGQAQNKAVGWNQCDERVNATEKRPNYDNSWGYHDRTGNTTTNHGSRGGYVDKGKNSVDNGNKWRGGNRCRDFGESSWGRNQWEPGLSRSSYYPNGSNYSANKNDWGHQKQCGQYGYGRSRGGFVGEREDVAGACRKREGAPGQNAPGHKGPRLQYTDQTSRRWNNGNSNKRVSFGAQ